MPTGDRLERKCKESSSAAHTSNASTPKSASTDDNADDDDRLPIDRGYAWVVVFACTFCSMVCVGLQRANGILFVEFLVLFHQPAGTTTLVLSIQCLCCGVAALLTQTVVLSVLSERQTMMLGGLCGGLGFALSYFATSLYFLIFTQGLLVGVATAMIIGPSYVIVNTYFRKRRSLASAINITGGNLGAILMSLLTDVLSRSYGVRGAMFVLGAIYLNVMVAAALLRPLLTAISTTLSCVTGLFTPLYSGFGQLVAFSVVYGLCGVVYFSLFPVVVVDLMGLSDMAKTLGFVQLFNFLAVAVAHPVIGYLRDLTGSYHASYYVMSGCGLLSASVLMFTPLATKHCGNV